MHEELSEYLGRGTISSWPDYAAGVLGARKQEDDEDDDDDDNDKPQDSDEDEDEDEGYSE